MDAVNAVPASERHLHVVMATLAKLARRPAPTSSAESSSTDPPEQSLTVRSHLGDSVSVGAQANRPLRNTSLNRLACLFRHWTWADEAMTRFERELAAGLEYDDDPLADHPFGAYYHWCALLCGFCEAALEQDSLSVVSSESLRVDLEASLPALRGCRQLLVVIPTSLEEHPRIVDLLHDNETINRLRRVHYAFHEALQTELLSRELDWLLYEH